MRNLFTELAESLEHDNFFGLDHHKREVYLLKAQRIIAELAKSDIGEIHMAATLPKDGRVILSCIDAATWNATDTIYACHKIAEEVKQ